MSERIRAIIAGYDLQAEGEVRREARSGETTDYPILPPNAGDGVYRAPLILFLDAFVKTHHLGRVLSDGTGFTLDDSGATVVPDIAFVSFERLAAEAYLDRVLSISPDLAVDRIGEGDSAEALHGRVMRYLNHGASQVWLIAMRPREVLVFTPEDRDGTTVTLEGSLAGRGPLDGFNVPLRAIFEEDKVRQIEVLRRLLNP